MSKFINEIELIVNTLIKAIKLYLDNEDRFNYIANRSGWSEDLGKYFPNNFLEKNELDLPVKFHPEFKNLNLIYHNLEPNDRYYTIELFRKGISRKEQLDNILNEFSDAWTLKLGKPKSDLKTELFGSSLRTILWKFKNYSIELQEVNLLSKDGRTSLDLIIREGFKKRTNFSQKNFIAFSRNLEIILEEISKLISQAKEEINLQDSIKITMDDIDQTIYPENEIFQEKRKDRNVFQIDLFENDGYSNEGFTQVYDLITYFMTAKFGIPVKVFTTSKNCHLREESKITIWKNNNHLISLSKYLHPYAYVSTTSIIFTKYEEETLNNYSRLIHG